MKTDSDLLKQLLDVIDPEIACSCPDLSRVSEHDDQRACAYHHSRMAWVVHNARGVINELKLDQKITEIATKVLEIPEKVAESYKTPLYLMTLDDPANRPEWHVEEWHPIQAAGVIFDSGWVRVRIGGKVLENGVIRDISAEEKASIADIADEYSARK